MMYIYVSVRLECGSNSTFRTYGKEVQPTPVNKPPKTQMTGMESTNICMGCYARRCAT